MADMNSGVINQRTTYAQDTPPSNNSESVIWIDTSSDPNNPKVYDTATSAWLPVNTTATVVSQTEPEVQPGHIWFEPTANGVNMHAPSNGWNLIQFLPDIPDSGLQHLFWGPSIIDPLHYPDVEGELEALSSDDPKFSSINNRQAAVYDGDDSYSVGSSLPLPSNSNNFTIAVVIDPIDNGSKQRLFDMGSTASTSGGYELQIEFGNSRYGLALSGQNKVVGGTLETGPQIIIATFDSSTGRYILDVNKTQKINTTDSTSGMASPQENTTIGAGAGGIDGTKGAIGAAGHEKGFADETRRDELTDIFADEFNISV